MSGQLGTMMDSFFYGFDTAVYSFFWNFQNDATIGIANICQYMGNTAAFIIYLAISLLICFPKKTRKFGVAMVVAFFVAFLLVNVMIKPGAARQRPYITLKDTPFWETYQTHHRIRMSIRPGMTGLWQISGRSNITDFEEVVRLDTEYIRNWSIWEDLKILLQTVYVVMRQVGAR